MCRKQKPFSLYPFLEKLKQEINLPYVMEIMDPRDIQKIYDILDIIQIGARNMKNYALLKEAGKSKKAVLLKRQPKTTLKEFLYSAEYLLKYGTKKIILCERGDNQGDDIPSINLEIIKEIKKHLRIPVIADISHSAKNRKTVIQYAKKTLPISDGIMVEVSAKPEKSITDTKQIIGINALIKIINLKNGE
jgi:3-deoxy-7-phosphoheptulonate synthase